MPLRTNPRHWPALAAILALAAGATAQTTVPGSGTPVTLSPFQVTEGQDQGYAATHSLAGGRMNTQLIMTPADVTVLTKDFLRDIGALDYLDAAPYITSMGQTGPVVTTDFGHNQSMFRGLPASVQTRNYFRVPRPVDAYVTERLESMRGPNSLLFGEGALGGGLNTMTKRARTSQDFTEVTLRADSEGSLYAALDVNRSAGPRAAVRTNVFGQRARYWIDRKTDERHGVHLAALHRPWAGGELRLEGEYGFSSTNYPPPFFRDTHSNYTTGYRVVAPLTVASPAPGVNRITTDTLIWSPTQAGRVFNLLNFGRTTGTNIAITPELSASLPGFARVPRNLSVQPRNGLGDVRLYLLAGYLEQRIGRDLTAEFSLQYANVARHARNIKWDNYSIDPNAVLPDGTPNPKFGVPFDEKAWRWYLQDSQGLDLRLALAWEVPIRTWSQRVNVAIFRRVESTDFETFQIGRSNNPANRLLSATVNEPLFRIYWDDPAPDFTAPPDDATYTWETLRTTDQRVNQTLNSAQVATVASFLEGRATIVAGARLDDYTQRQRDGAARDAAGRFTAVAWQGADARPVTSSAGVVWFPFRLLGGYANYAETFGLATAGGRGLNGEVFGPTRAHSRSGGLRFRLGGESVVGSLGYYSSREAGRLLQYQSAAINRIWTNLNRGEMQVDPALTNYRDSLDYQGSGLELDLTANLGRALRVRGNLARPRTRQTNTVPGLRAYYARHIAEWRAGAQNAANPNRAQIATDITSIETTLTNSNEGRVLNNTPDYTGSIFGMYTVQRGPLRGFRGGGGIAWQGPRVIGNITNRPFDYLWSDSYRTVNLSLGYPLRFRGRTMDLQFNVTNLLDHSEPLYTGTGVFRNETIRTTFHYLDPRKASLAATQRF